jgi:hypothetical protein
MTSSSFDDRGISLSLWGPEKRDHRTRTIRKIATISGVELQYNSLCNSFKAEFKVLMVQFPLCLSYLLTSLHEYKIKLRMGGSSKYDKKERLVVFLLKNKEL